jgi:probable rRNA maturation factor
VAPEREADLPAAVAGRRDDPRRGPAAGRGGRPCPGDDGGARCSRGIRAGGASAPASIGLILADDAELAALNEAHLGHHGPTDVLSFPLQPADAFPPHAGEPADRRGGRPVPAFPMPPGRRLHLGDVVVSVERAIEQAVEGRGGHTGDVRWSPGDEMRLLAIHGTLHVCGWDHAEPAEESAMRALERRLLG